MKSIILGIFLGQISVSEGVQLKGKLPPYFSEFWSGTWRYCERGDQAYCGNDQFIADAPPAYKANIGLDSSSEGSTRRQRIH